MSTPVLWLSGPPGVGKTAVGWEVYSRLAGSGIRTGYVDIDQLGICYPEPSDDPGRHRMQARNLAGVVADFRAAGARCVVVSGVVDVDRGVPVDLLQGVALTVCLLRAAPEELERRFLGRGEPVEQVEHVLREAEALDARDFADFRVDTTGLPVVDVARRVLEHGWPVLTDPGPCPSAAAPRADGPVLWLCGVTGVGKSAVGFDVYRRVLRTGRRVAYVDLDQLGFLGPAPADHGVRARNLAVLWGTYRAAGAEAVVVVGPVEDAAAFEVYAQALPAATITLCGLHAGRARLAERIAARGRGGGWWQPGDPLRGRSTAHLLRVAERAAADAEALRRTGIGDLWIDTGALSAEDAAEEVLSRSGWPDLTRCAGTGRPPRRTPR
ncbi:broad-specificity NMP kinase [Saccharothrix coeruleofusca]|uniref:AAA family ATPase n=1 Tax=Saccharothrix coeruleofusca TaxID=33919 RepID=UPI001AE1DF3B|nr:AAA family ATPase [Saccharothrix coeruleofusca]MBP2336941.1 broad-specificity NMP kinase [Saccharothrix coeruleofusca]